MDLHPAVAHLAPLLGIWRGAGRGDYPTIDPFEYTEEVTIGHVGKPFLAYNQRTKSADGTPMHAECGYWRPAGEQGLELLIVHPSGIGEMLVGTVTETHYGLLVMLRAGGSGSVGSVGRVLLRPQPAPRTGLEPRAGSSWPRRRSGSTAPSAASP